MKLLTAILGVFSLALGQASLADDGFLLAYKDGHHFVVKASPTGVRELISVGNQTTFGDSASYLGLLSQKNGDSELTILDKRSLQVRGSWPIAGLPVAQLSGASPDVVMTDRFVYFLTMRTTPIGTAMIRNTAGGIFAFNKLSLPGGKLQTWPLSDTYRNPRLVKVGQAAFLYTWNGSNVWRFDDATGTLVQVVSANDIDESIVTSSNAVPGAIGAAEGRSDFVISADTGVFRLSRRGTLQHVLQKDFATAAPAGSIDLRGQDPGKIVKMYGSAAGANPSIGILRKEAEQFAFANIDPLDGRVRWKLSLPNTIVIDSLLLAKDGSLYYADAAAATIQRASPSGTREVWSLEALGPDIDLSSTRILSVTPESTAPAGN